MPVLYKLKPFLDDYLTAAGICDHDKTSKTLLARLPARF
jgi:hypothetical protein